MESNQSLQLSNNSIGDLQTLSKTFHESGMFNDIKSASQALVKILAGSEVGLPPFQSMSGIHIIQGKPVIGAGLIASKIKGSGKYDYKVIQQDEKACSIDFYQGKEKIGNSTFTMEDAKKADTKNIQKFPKNMLFARAISNGVKWYCPDVFSGSVYVNEERDLIKAETIDTEYNEVEGEELTQALIILDGSANLEELQTNWTSLTKEQRKITSVLAKKEELKTKLSA